MTTAITTRGLDPQFAEPPNGMVVTDRRSASMERSLPQMDPLLAVMDKLANNPNLDADKIERLLTVFLDGQRKMAEMQDEKLFSDALAAFKYEPDVVRILKDKKNKQYDNSPYVSLGREASIITPLLSKHGLTATWSLEQAEKIKIGCQLSYGIFHATPVTVSLAPDVSGAKNAAQQVKSSITYGRIITLECACGIAPVDSIASVNDDGNALGNDSTPAITEKQEAELQDYADALRQCDTLPQLQSLFSQAYAFAKGIGDHHKSKMTAVYNQCKVNLMQGGAK